MTADDKTLMNESGVTHEEYRQSTRNFLRLAEAVVRDTSMDRITVTESMMNAVLLLMISDIGRDGTAVILEDLAAKQRQAAMHERGTH
jgi:hypothetical protein